MPIESDWPTFGSSLVVPLGFLLGIGAAVVLWALYSRTRFGFEVGVIADSPRAARYAGMRTRRKILAVMGMSGAVAGIGGASQIGDFTHTLDGSPSGLQAAAFGYTGIVVAALARYNPFAVCLVAVLIGGLQNAGFTLQGADFPSGLVGVMQGIILFCALGGELLIRYRVRLHASRPGGRAGHGARRREHQRQPARVRARAGRALRHAAALRRPRRAARGAVRRAQPRRRGDDAVRRGGRLLGDTALRRCERRRPRSRPCSRPGAAGAAMAAIHAFLTVTLRASQIVSGLALTIFAGGLGLSAYFGTELGLADLPPTHQFGSLDVFGLGDLWVFGPILFDQSALVYGSWALTAAIALYLTRTRWGLNVRAVGESPATADAMGISVTRYRYVHVIVGGALAGVGGACYSLSITPGWTSGDTLVERRGVDRHRARHLRVLACRALPRRRVPLRRPFGAAVRAAGPRRAGDAGVPPGAAVRDDGRRARPRLDGPGEASRRRARRPSACPYVREER